MRVLFHSYHTLELTDCGRLNEVTSQLEVIQQTLGIRVGNTGNGIEGTPSRLNTSTQEALSRPGALSSETPETFLTDPPGEWDGLEFYETSGPDEVTGAVFAAGNISLDPDQVRELYIQLVYLGF